ncbi:hypothetical protein BO71DRAFT_468670 [Aspergillus ellipticus CBS 707.79]|uniref:Zn(2)-C6 fungal-type domain-containing protein n=1 Tax=Aspergillus ellipticus CBS 707.79 TaxID=1448320 RepID=A0A319DJQ3_9EURO|nr:hypothetical protein BO71DRAFT_468670 [Aspergillus ellipticus CBS 707.79]
MEGPPWAEQPSLSISPTGPNSSRNVNSLDRSLSAPEVDLRLPQGKIPLPRLAEGMKSSLASQTRAHRRHVARACESCRQRKTKCTGDSSGCRNCREGGIICCYTDGKREKSKRQLASLVAKLRTYEYIMMRLSIRFGIPIDQLMADALNGEGPSSQDSQSDTNTSHSEAQRPSGAHNTDMMLFMDPVNSYDSIQEDFNRDEISQATGFIGQSSEIVWLQTLKRELNCESEPSQSNELIMSLSVADRSLISALNYYIDDQEMPNIKPLDIFSMPSTDVAMKLYKIYLEWVHPSFPIIGISAFGSQFHAFFNTPNLKPGNKWLAILNMVFALAAKYAYISEADLKLDKNDHYSFFSKARILSMDDRLFHHSDLQQLQVEGLASLYMLARGHLNRAWKLCGIAIRGAVGLGLHLRNTGELASDTSREIRYRVWWSLYMIDHRLTIMTGRPSCIDDNVCTTPLPVPFDECDFGKEEAIIQLQNSPRASPSHLGRLTSLPSDLHHTSPPTTASRTTDAISFPSCGSLYFLQLVKIMLISKKMNAKLYSPGVMCSPWLSIEFCIRGLQSDIETWHLELPKDYDFTSTQSSQITQATAHQRMSLALLFYSTKMSITRPCLRPLSSIGEDDKMHDFCKKTAAECVESACHMLRLFPDEVDSAALYRSSPWWCILHFLMQATAILLLELAFDIQHTPEKASMVYKAAEKSHEWLRSLAKSNMESEKARHVCDRLRRQIEKRANINMPIIPHISPSPHGSQDNDIRALPTVTGVNGKAPAPETPSYKTPSDVLPLMSSTSAINAASCSYISESPGSFSSMETESQTVVPSAYEGNLPYDPNTGQITASFFPNFGLDMDLGDCLTEDF